MPDWDDIAHAISDAIGAAFVIESRDGISGGCINECYVVRGRGSAWFVKLNAPARLTMFEAEAAGLNEIAATRTVRVPQPLCHGANAETSWLVLEYISLGSGGGGASMRALGRQLAALHRATSPTFGWHRDNTIGATPQVNTPSADWVTFWREHRLGYQLRLAKKNGYRGKLQAKGDELLKKLPAFFRTYRPQPSLLHGDLWGGNVSFDAQGAPVIFDPAAYYGDREADLAMTELFGSFGPEVYSAYREEYPPDAGYATRKHLYNLYHVLNHLNLFGGSYGVQAERMMDQLLAQA